MKPVIFIVAAAAALAAFAAGKDDTNPNLARAPKCVSYNYEQKLVGQELRMSATCEKWVILTTRDD